MSQLKTITILCDPCLNAARPKERDGVEVTITIGRRRTKRIAFCETHKARLLDPMIGVLEATK